MSDWLTQLKPGDVVGVHQYLGRHRGHETVKRLVLRVSSTGRITLDDGRVFRADGNEFRRDGTDRLVDWGAYRQERLALRLSQENWYARPLEVLETVVGMLEER